MTEGLGYVPFTLDEACVGRDHAYKKYPRMTLLSTVLCRLGDTVLQRMHGPSHPSCEIVLTDVMREIRCPDERRATKCAIAKMLNVRAQAARAAARRREERKELATTLYRQLSLL